MTRARAALGALMLLFASPHALAAQQPALRTLSGVVADSASRAPLLAVQVAMRAVGDTGVARAGSTDEAGRFAITGVAPGRYQVRFIRLGFSPDTQVVTVAAGVGPVNMGTILMTTTTVQLGGVEVVASQADVVHTADRDIYSAEAIVGAAGESLALFLEQFAAENIQSIEVLPNPSARYGAEGAGGIVNIVLKENVGLGISGNAFVNGGTRGQLRGGDRDGGQGARGRNPRGRGNELRVEVEYERGSDLEQRFVERRILQELGEVDYADELTWEEDRQTDSELAVGVDYVHGLGESAEVELGYEGEFGWSDEGRLEELLAPGSPGSMGDPISSERRGFAHRQTVHGAYLTLSRQFGGLGAQLGARAEHTGNRLELPGDGGVYENDHLDVFPNANLNYSW